MGGGGGGGGGGEGGRGQGGLNPPILETGGAKPLQNYHLPIL